MTQVRIFAAMITTIVAIAVMLIMGQWKALALIAVGIIAIIVVIVVLSVLWEVAGSMAKKKS